MNALIVLERGLGSRWKAIAIIAVTILAFLLMGIEVVDSMDSNIYDSLPPAMLSLAGIPAGAATSVMAYAQMLGFLGAITAAGFAVAVGAQVIAGEEQDRTLPLLLSHPVSRLGVGIAKAGVLVATAGIMSLGLWGAAQVAALPFNLALGNAHLGELCLALGANALLCGSVAFAVGGMTGSRGLATGVASVVLGFGWLLASLLPQWSQTRDLAQFIPWYWYSKPVVLVNGLDGGYLALMLGVAATLLAAGVVGVMVRDLRSTPLRLSWPHRRQTPERAGTQRLADNRVATTVRAPGLTGLAISRHTGLLLVLGMVMFAVMGVSMGPVYDQMAPQLVTVSQSMPSALLQMWGATDMASPAGFYWGETMSLMAPATVTVAGAAIATALGSDERSGCLGLLLAAGLPRWRVLAYTITAQAIVVTAIAILTGLGIWGGTLLGDVSLPAGNIAGAALHLLALGLFVSATATLAVAAVGTPAAAAWTATGVGLVGYFINVTLPMNPNLADWAKISPFHWYGASHPLENGPDWGGIAVLLAAAAVLLAASFPLFTRRDLRV